MDVRIAIPEEHVSAPVLNAGLEAVTRLNEQLIREGSSPTFGEAVKSGVRWKPEPPGLESFDHGGKVAARGWGDCDDLAPLRSASLRVSGEDKGARAVVFKSGPGRWHAIVKRSDGTFEDPSQTAGMNVRKGSVAAGIPPAVVGCGMRSSVSGPVRPWVAVKPFDNGHLARVDLPFVAGVLPLVGEEHALSFTHYGATPAKALSGCMAGACVVGGATELTHEEHLEKLWALSGLLRGKSAAEVAGECGVDVTKDALQSLQDIAPALVQALRDHWQDAKDLREKFARRNGKGSVSGSPFSDRFGAHRSMVRGTVLAGTQARSHGRKVSLAGTVDFGRAFDRACGVNPDRVGDMFSDIASFAAPVLKPLAKVVQPIANVVTKVYSSLPKPLVATLSPQALVTDFAIKNPSSIPMFGQLATQAKNVYEQGIAAGKPVSQAVAMAHTVLHPAMQHPAVAAAPPAVKKAVALHIAAKPPPPPKPAPKPVPGPVVAAKKPAALPTLAQVVRMVAPRVINAKVVLPIGTRHA